MTPVRLTSLSDLLIITTILWLGYQILSRRLSRSSVKSSPLRGPPSASYFWGSSKEMMESPDQGLLLEEWRKIYGPVYSVVGTFGSNRIILLDPKAVAHFYARETYGYVQNKLSRMFIENLFGRGLLWAEGDSHKRQRKALAPAFSNVAIRRLATVFYDSTYKAMAAWDNMLASAGDGAIIDVQEWMNHISLDSIGIAGFSHDFQSLDGVESSVARVFKSFERGDSPINPLTFLLAPILPWVFKLPTKRKRLMDELRASMSELANQLLEKTKREDVEEKSIIGLLIKAENADGESGMSQEEILAQMNVLLLAGYETTSISLTWTLIELSRNTKAQDTLRNELLEKVGTTDPSYEQLMSVNELPYLDAVVHEILRLHPPVGITSRTATEDDVIPLSQPIITATGETISSIVVAKGTNVFVPIRASNRLEAFWGEDAKIFRPERWLETDKDEFEFNAIQGHRHLLTFVDGPRTCLGKNFALTEFKAALSTLVRNYTFEFPNGPETEIGKCMSVLPRPKVVGEEGSRVPLRVRRVQ